MGASSRKLELQDELERKQQYVTDRKEELAQSKKQYMEKRIQSYNEVRINITKVYRYNIQSCSPNSNIALFASYFQSPRESI